MTTKVNGAAYSGIWVEKRVAFVKLTFNTDISALAAGSLYILGTTTAAGTSTVADSTFAVVESAIVQALKTVGTKATILGVSKYSSTANTVDVMLGFAEGWIAPATDGIILAAGQAVTGAKAVATVASTAGATVNVGDLLDVTPTAVTFTLQYAAFDGKMTAGTGANGAIVNGVGGWYPNY